MTIHRALKTTKVRLCAKCRKYRSCVFENIPVAKVMFCPIKATKESIEAAKAALCKALERT